MKTSSTITVALLASWILSATTSTGAETNGTYLEVLQASNNVAAVIQTLPDVEKLWPQNPDAYLKSINQAVRALDSQLNSSGDATQAFANMFVKIMQKSCPTNEADAASWVSQKREMVFFCMVHDQIGHDKSNWLAVAQFLGEIRAKKIPNYVNQEMNISIAAPTPAEQLELQKELADNERKKITDNFQSELLQADSTLTFLIQHACPFTQPNQPVDTNFINQVTSAAHLTDAESQKLQRANAN